MIFFRILALKNCVVFENMEAKSLFSVKKYVNFEKI